MAGADMILQPQIVAWEMTRRCPLACRHCRAVAGAGRSPAELSAAEGLRLIGGLGAFPIRLLILTGGEPMLRDDLYDQARAAADRDIRVVVATCGALLTETTAARLKAAGVSAVSISLDAANAEAHDAFRGVAGAFETAWRGLRCARGAGLGLQVNTTVTRMNCEQLPAILERAEAAGAATLDCFFLVPTGRGRALREYLLDAAQVERTLHWIADMDASRSIRVKSTCAPQMARIRTQRAARGAPQRPDRPGGGCMAGRGFLFVSHGGDVQPCGFLNLVCGNVRDFDFDLSALIAASGEWSRLGALEGIGGACGRCAYLRVCGGCRARALEMDGDAYRAEPFCVGGADHGG